MIETAFFFLLGFLCACLLALMIAPAIWRRAVALTRRRIEASVPLTMDEIAADKDRLRAEFAMSTRRLEMSIKSFRERAAKQIVEINRNQEELKRLAEDRDEKNRAISELETKAAELRAELRRREEQLQQTADRLSEANRVLEERALEIEKLGGMYEEASIASSTRQIDLVARESEIEKLSSDVGTLRDQRRDADKRVREITAENKGLRQSLRDERSRIGELEAKLERVLSTSSDQEERVERREKDLSRLREQLKEATVAKQELEARLAAEEAQRVALEVELTDSSGKMAALLSGAKGADIDNALGKLVKERDRLEERLTALWRENKRLRAEASAQQRTSSDVWAEERRQNAVLREQINDLAAEVVSMTAMLDGPDSPIRKVLSEAETPGAAGTGEHITSLADRVRALQKASADKQ